MSDSPESKLRCGACNNVIAYYFSCGAPHACYYYCEECKNNMENDNE